MNDGLKDEHREAILAILRAHPGVKKAVLFGSRAMGTFTPESDVDICLYGESLTLTDQARLAGFMEEASVPQRVDLLLHHAIRDPALLEHIRREGKVWFERGPGEWRDTVLGDVITLKRGYDLPAHVRMPGSVPVVSSSGVTDHHAVAMVKGPGVVTGRYGTLGQVFFIQEDFWPLNTTLYVRDFKGNDPRFISYFLRSLDFLAFSDKAAVPGLNRNHLHQAAVRVPSDVCEQRAIAHILGTLDDKIELNRRMSETLEAMAQALFKSWFVDFDPVRAKAEGRDPGLPPHLADLFPDRLVPSELGEIPEGWEVKSLDKVAQFINGLALQKYPPVGDRSLPVIKIAQLRAGHSAGADRASADLHADYVVNDGDILFSWSGALECRLWAGGPGALNQHLFKVTSDSYPRWLCYLGIHLYLDDFRRIAAGKATTMRHIQRHHLSDAKLPVPPTVLLDAMDLLMAPLIDSIWRRAVESRTLAALRDALLPKLVSGELRVPHLDRFEKENA